MRVIKLGIVSIVVFSVVLILISMLIPSKVRISRAVNIAAEASKVRPKLSSTDSWTQWNEITGEGMAVTIDSVSPTLITTTWKYGAHSTEGAFAIYESAGITVVQWYFDFKLRWYPWEKLGSITFDKQFGPVMENSLNKLKKLVENSP